MINKLFHHKTSIIYIIIIENHVIAAPSSSFLPIGLQLNDTKYINIAITIYLNFHICSKYQMIENS